MASLDAAIESIEPVRLSTTVAQRPDDAFRLFTEGIGSWWPLREGKSFGGERATGVYLEPVTGGRFYERWTNGEEFEVGRVLACEPPKFIVFTWKGTYAAATEVDVRFIPEGSGTRVDVEHRGWERLGPHGRQHRGSYANGWPGVLSRYRDAAGSGS